MNHCRLLAKSYDRKQYPEHPPDYALLIQHSRDVAAACKALAQVAGSAAMFNAGLDSERLEQFALTLLANGWIQDLGKANSHFQAMVTDQNNIRQLLRHEVISGLLLFQNKELQDWLSPLSEIKLMALWGAMGHHRKFDDNTQANPMLPALTVHVTHPDFRAILIEIAADLHLELPPEFERDLVIAPHDREGGDVPAREAIIELIEEFEDSEFQFKNEADRRFLALVKAYGIAADVAASAVAKREKSAQRYSLSQFVQEDLSIGLTPHEITTLIHIYAWQTTKLDSKLWDVTKLPPNFLIRDFQNKVAASGSYLTLAKAGCGSGKSLAAYLWAKGWCDRFVSQNRHNFRLFFCLPTTGTTTEHFKDYALESGIPASLSHSRSKVDLQTIASTVVEEEAQENASAAEAACQSLKAEQDKIEALALWSTPLVVTTADTVLGLMANARRAIYSCPAIMQAAIVFDEIHAFDDFLFGHLLVFLKNFPQLPVLLMTASLPEERRQALEKIRPDLHCVPGPEALETLSRYLLEYSVTPSSIWEKIQECIENNGKVLWVRNRVDWANEAYDNARDRFPGVSVNVYHSRLRYKDRSRRHRQVIDDFKAVGKSAILIATQVAEMSLDLSADLLITDIAPVPALIQRLGRLNRRATPECPGEPKQALICPLGNPKQDAKPYELKELETAEIWIECLNSLHRPLNQRDLAEKFAELSNPRDFDYAIAENRACFFSGLWRTRPGLTRSEGYTISVILQKDYEKCDEFEYGQPASNWLRKHEVAIPVKDPALKWERVAGIRIAPDDAIYYDYQDETHEGKGAVWR
ncbi:CRISPR-associated helicase Cas3' [Laspinema sp. D1]|uniref:CRISPR-associated helicase Cas3' n=1 Tax=Laspinema palackyanum TaxID=3231601 RepID=UPI003483B169|nr:CRISPR-associated helicase Cas3' [Laspinema sp. D2b]